MEKIGVPDRSLNARCLQKQSRSKDDKGPGEGGAGTVSATTTAVKPGAARGARGAWPWECVYVNVMNTIKDELANSKHKT